MRANSPPTRMSLLSVLGCHLTLYASCVKSATKRADTENFMFVRKHRGKHFNEYTQSSQKLMG